MDANFIDMIIPVAFGLVGLALVWLLVELALTMRKARAAVEDLAKEAEPIIKDAAELTESLKPTVAKLDPLMDRVNLTIDAANLEIMRVDTILEDVGDITNTISNASKTVDTIASAPVAAVSSVSDKVREVINGKKAGRTSVDLANAKRAAAADEGQDAEVEA